jgi:hypothetical protein
VRTRTHRGEPCGEGELFVQSKGRLLPILRFVFKRGSSGKVIEGAFVGNKGRTVFRRVGKARLPIEPVRVIDVGQMFRSKKVSGRVLERINRDLPIEVDRAVKSVRFMTYDQRTADLTLNKAITR